MALTIEIQYSVTSPVDGAFIPLTTIPDNGSGFSYNFTSGTNGQLYIFRARRRDDTKAGTVCEYSDWSILTVTRAPNSTEGKPMAVNDILTGTDTSVWVAIEPAEGIPTKVSWAAEYLSGGIVSDLMRLYSRALRNAPTMRRKVVAGRAVYAGDLEIEITPEGPFPRLMAALFPFTSTSLSGPARWRHRFYNAFNSKTVTLVQQKGQTTQTNGALYVYPGTKVSAVDFTFSKEQDAVLTARFSLVALDEWVYELATVPTAPTLLGTSTASTDTLNPYSPVNGVATIGTLTGAGVRSMTFGVQRNLGKEFVFDGYRGARQNYEGRNDVTGSAGLFFEAMTNLRRDMTGSVSTPTGVYAANETIAVTNVSLVYTPPLNAAGFSNILGFYIPNCDIKTDQPVQGEAEIPENLQFFPIDAVGEASGTDFYVEITNSESFTSLNMPGAAIVAAPTTTVDRVYLYAYGVVTAGNTSLVIAGNSPQVQQADATYAGRTMRFLRGNNGSPVQQERTINGSGYGGSPGAFTLGSPLPNTVLPGDVFDIV